MGCSTAIAGSSASRLTVCWCSYGSRRVSRSISESRRAADDQLGAVISVTESGRPQSRGLDDAQKHAGRAAIWVMVLCAVLALGLAVRLVSITGKHTLEGDEAVTYLAATGHQLAYGQGPAGLSDHWVPASLWKSYLHADGFWGFTRIRVGLNRTDNHPPLYFWALHVWVWIFGVHLWSGPLLNTIIALGTGLVLFVLARRVLHNPLQAALVTAVWIVSHPVVDTSMWARDYELLALFGVLSALALCRLVDRSRHPSWRDVVLLAAVVAGGLLSHYEYALFVLVVIAAAAVLVVLQRQARRLWHVLGGLVLGVAVSVVLNPGFLASYERQRAQASALSVYGMVARVGNVARSLETFFWWIYVPPKRILPRAVRFGRPVVLVVLVVLVVFLLALALSPGLRHRVARWARRRTAGDWLLMAAGLAAVVTTIGSYILMRVPVYAMGTRYLALLWPFLALGTVCILRLLPRSSLLMAVILVSLVVAPMSIHGFVAGSRGGAALAPPVGTQAIVFDNARRTILLRSLWSVPDNTLVFAGSQATLLDHPSSWLQGLKPGDLLFTTLRQGGTRKDSQEIVALLDSRFTTVPYGGINLMPGPGYRVVRPRGRARRPSMWSLSDSSSAGRRAVGSPRSNGRPRSTGRWPGLL